ncbi:glycosyltransferase [Candidatus Saccharibacteria bacterium]|jgi:UDP-N-acetylglucosamine--N-acetylmuramyl-(pentapeptide) pyrophosphoryl-undecaprenol N-acetylglucosamine transferase|nr:glycosyltransferase [Candidatus Saccharibacteria bacterium]
MSKLMKVVLVGGGSGGHVIPLREVSREILECNRSVNLLIISNFGYRDRTEQIFKTLLKEHPERLSLKFIYGGKFRRYDRNILQELLDIKTQLLNLKDLLKFMLGFLQSKLILFRIEPLVVFCKSGTGALEFCLAARKKATLITHDSDSRLGLTNKILSKYAKICLFGLPKTVDKIDSKEVIGVPIDSNFKAATKIEKFRARAGLGLTENGKVVLVYGGSLGAAKINEALFENLKELNNLGVQILHQVGSEAALVKAKRLKAGLVRPDLYIPFEFSEKIAEMYLAVDLVIGRSGATTIQEIANAGMPSILIPAQLSDQQKNARLLDLMKASEVVREDELTKNVSILFKKVELILRDEQLKKVLSESVLRLAKYNSAKQIAELILTHRFEPKLVRKS